MPLNSQATPNNSELAGQVAVATGGGRGIGRAIAATLSEARMTLPGTDRPLPVWITSGLPTTR